MLSLLNLQAQCSTNFAPDLPLLPSNSTIQLEINNIYDLAKNTKLASSAPTTSKIITAIAQYDNLNIVVNGSNITGNPVTSYNTVSFIGTFADYLQFNPSDNLMIERVNNLMWWVYANLCDGTLPINISGYAFRNFSRKGFFCIEFLTTENKERALYIVEKELDDWGVFWKPSYDYNSQLTDGTINTDHIYNKLDALIPLIKCFDTEDEQYRYMLTFSRFVNRFVSTSTNGTHDGLKPDGSGYHHWNNYESYMYAYTNAIYVLKMLDNTIFQIDAGAYHVFRNAVMHKLLNTNDDGFLPLCMTGRSANWEEIEVDQSSLKDLAIIGGHILNLATADAVLAGIYNRRYGIEPTFNYSSIAPFHYGFYQNNHACTGIFRTNNSVIISKGFNDILWGSEIYATENRYGRYQSYGALSVVYPGDRNANGFNNTKWDWNFNPGSTTKVLPWDKLIAGWNRIDENSNKRFSGSLQFNLQTPGFLDNVFGTYGMFAMDFQEKEDLGWGGVTAPDTHDPTFTFKKSYFFFDDMVVCLGSDINNSDSAHNTVTTLYQNSTTPSDVTVNNSVYSLTDTTTIYPESNDNWVLDNFATGFYIVQQSGDLKVQRKDQETPSHDQNDPTILNPPTQAAIGYLDHGSSPLNEEYEYIVVPNTNSSAMQAIETAFSSPISKPYEVINKSSNSHIIQHKATGIYGLALFNANATIPGNTNINSNDSPCLMMYESINLNTEMQLSLSNPDMGLPIPRSYNQYSSLPIQIEFEGVWQLEQPHPNISFVSSDANTSTFSFSTYQGLPIEASFKKIHTDIVPVLSFLPSNINGLSNMLFTIKIQEVGGLETLGEIAVVLAKDPRLTMLWNPEETNLGPFEISNSNWNYNNNNTSFHIWTTNISIDALSSETFGSLVIYDPQGASGFVTYTATIIQSGGGDSNILNNIDAETIIYFSN